MGASGAGEAGGVRSVLRTVEAGRADTGMGGIPRTVEPLGAVLTLNLSYFILVVARGAALTLVAMPQAGRVDEGTPGTGNSMGAVRAVVTAWATADHRGYWGRRWCRSAGHRAAAIRSGRDARKLT